MTMPRRTSRNSPSLYYDVPIAIIPLISSILLLIRLYRWQQSQYYQLLNLIDYTMEHTISRLSSGSRGRGPTTFPKFNELPPELRIKIFQYAMPDPRTVVVKSPHSRQAQTPRSLEEAMSGQHNHEGTWYSTAQIPALLHVNAEARYEALKHYKLSLGVGNAQPRIYVDFSRDTVFFGNSELKPECSELWASTRDLDRVQRLAVVPEGAWRVLRWKKVDLNSLERMIFVHDTENFELGPLPQLVEDEPQVIESALLEEDVRRVEDLQLEEDLEENSNADPMKKRMQAAREELDTLMTVLPTQWEREPTVSTGVFKKICGDKWLC
ncbi:uncharacterized protein GGS22DRAFT_173262 [Annulohypoxylon maeteangense]|uniref:uncharacterized protein n=1 Tax=Annulohypoxylon maeteangense TaxID=1927788 RepID=UPI00200822B9|nr:uncharacterized protein GGS22DRAFT_173262 [Annulohypoxylon maeteangense]KAI0881067.1 hypothetical protein GGS22DRAFT_173262 [Annulohypoxylon maeteangense]